MMIKPMPKHVLLVQKKVKKTTESGVIIKGADDAFDTPTGVVVNVGDEVKDVSIGDEVYADWSGGQVTQVEGLQAVILKEKNILAVVPNDNA